MAVKSVSLLREAKKKMQWMKEGFMHKMSLKIGIRSSYLGNHEKGICKPLRQKEKSGVPLWKIANDSCSALLTGQCVSAIKLIIWKYQRKPSTDKVQETWSWTVASCIERARKTQEIQNMNPRRWACLRCHDRRAEDVKIVQFVCLYPP